MGMIRKIQSVGPDAPSIASQRYNRLNTKRTVTRRYATTANGNLFLLMGMLIFIRRQDKHNPLVRQTKGIADPLPEGENKKGPAS